MIFLLVRALNERLTIHGAKYIRQQGGRDEDRVEFSVLGNARLDCHIAPLMPSIGAIHWRITQFKEDIFLLQHINECRPSIKNSADFNN